MTRRPNAVDGPGCDARQTCPSGDGPAMGSRQTKPSPPQSASAAQRHLPSGSAGCSRTQVVAAGQSDSSAQAIPSKIGSSVGQPTPQLVLEVMMISAL